MSDSSPLRQPSTPWKEKRQARGPLLDPKKKAKADRERFRRGRRGAYKRLNDLFMDGLEIGRERRVYAVILNKARGSRSTARYSTYNSHPHDDWVPSVEELAEHWPKPDMWIPSNFEEKEGSRPEITSQKNKSTPVRRRLFSVSKPPALDLPQTPLQPHFFQ